MIRTILGVVRFRGQIIVAMMIIIALASQSGLTLGTISLHERGVFCRDFGEVDGGSLGELQRTTVSA